MKFGDIYFLPKFKAKRGIGNHFIVLLFADQETKKVYFQTLESGIYKIFPNFGILNGNKCATCDHSKSKNFRKYLLNKSMYLDVDRTIFLNFNKYKFLSKETFIYLQKVEKDNFFSFEQMVKDNSYKYIGSISSVNKKQALVAILYSKQISPKEKEVILSFPSPS